MCVCVYTHVYVIYNVFIYSYEDYASLCLSQMCGKMSLKLQYQMILVIINNSDLNTA